MPLDKFPGNPEILDTINQRFSGTIQPEVINAGPDKLEVSMLSAEVASGSVLAIPSDQPPNPILGRVGDKGVIAEFSLGGGSTDEYNKPLPPQNMFVITKAGGEHMGALTDIVEGLGVEDNEAGFLLAVERAGKAGVEGFTFIAEHQKHIIIGRDGTKSLPWVNGTGEKPDSEEWNPFVQNKSISRHQLMLANNDGVLVVRGESDQSHTTLKTRAFDGHQEVVTAQNQTEQATAVTTSLARRIGQRALGLKRSQ